jgi:hypothetical protein
VAVKSWSYGFWAIIFLIKCLPRLVKLSGRLVLWGARTGEDFDRLLENPLFEREWASLLREMEAFQNLHHV